jgi:hypothetical protein
MIVSLILTVGVLAAPPSPRAIHEHRQTIERRHDHHRRMSQSAAHNQSWSPSAGYWTDWPVYYPATAGQLPPYWDAAYGGFLNRMAEATW